MLRKIFSLGALVVVAVTFGVGSATAAPKKGNAPAAQHNNGNGGRSTDGFSDGRD